MAPVCIDSKLSISANNCYVIEKEIGLLTIDRTYIVRCLQNEVKWLKNPKPALRAGFGS